MSNGDLSRAFYRHPAFLPHQLLSALGIRSFVIGNPRRAAAIAVVTHTTLVEWRTILVVSKNANSEGTRRISDGPLLVTY